MSHQPLHALARRYEPRFAKTFLASVSTLKESVTDELVAEVMRGGLVDEPEALYELVDEMRLAKAAEDDVYAELIAEAGRLELRLRGHGRLIGRFNLTSPFVLEAAKKYAANLVTRVNAETKRAIRKIIFEAIRDGDAPVVAARTIREIVGLTERHAIAVKRFAEGQLAAATTPRLRALAERRIERYSRKLLNWRSRNIARTETITASRVGQQEAWRQMARDGLIDMSRFWQKWSTVPDDRLCNRCAPMEGKLVRLNSKFTETERGVLPSERVPVAGVTHEGPALHPQCRCSLVAYFDD